MIGRDGFERCYMAVTFAVASKFSLPHVIVFTDLTGFYHAFDKHRYYL